MRKLRGVSKADLARRIGVSRSYVTRLEQGGLQPSVKVMFRIASYFKFRIDVVFQWVKAGDETGQGCSGSKCRLPVNGRTLAPAPAKPVCKQSATLSAYSAVMESAKDKSLVNPTAKVVAPALSRSNAKWKK